MSEELQENTSRESGRRPGVALIVAAVLVIGAVAAAAIIFSKKHKEEVTKVEEALKVDTIPATPDNLIGNWSIKTEVGGETIHNTGYIDLDILGECVLHILSEYEPRQLIIDINEDGTLYSDELGLGEMSHKESTDRTEIKFEKEDSICTLTK